MQPLPILCCGIEHGNIQEGKFIFLPAHTERTQKSTTIITFFEQVKNLKQIMDTKLNSETQSQTKIYVILSCFLLVWPQSLSNMNKKLVTKIPIRYFWTGLWG
jgi:hypothetical protein